MGVSVKTVETYRARLKQKLEIKSRVGLLKFAVEWTLIGRPFDRVRLGLSPTPLASGNGHSQAKPDFPFSKDGSE
jgi:hypothetical protein